MDIQIRLAKLKDLKAYTKLLQETYSEFYTNEALKLTKECFSMTIFESSDTQKYLKSNLRISSTQKTWLAFKDNKLIGSITIQQKETECELRGFYVAKEYQGKGIGKKLWQSALEFSGSKDIVLDIYTHNIKTITIYKKWGFIIDKEKGRFYRHWPEWPEDIKAECLYMRLKK